MHSHKCNGTPAEQVQKDGEVSGTYCSPEKLGHLVSAIARTSGVPPSDANILADALVEADTEGTSTHGISRLDIYIRRIQKGLIDPAAEPRVERQKGAVLMIDAANGLGQVQAVKALDKLVPVAREYGIAACTIRNSQHFGALSYYCNKAAEQDMILLATTNSEPSMAPEGGCEPFFGTNPIATSFPTGEGYPVKIDLATSLVARGNIITAQKKGESIPEEWAQTRDGHPTTDPAEALAGAMLPMAGHKGYALALLVETFSSVLSGAAIGPEVGSMYHDFEQKQNVGHFFFLMDIAAFMDISDFKRRMNQMIDGIKSGRKRPGVEEIRIPGERSRKKAEQARKRGIFIEENTLCELERLCEELGIEFKVH